MKFPLLQAAIVLLSLQIFASPSFAQETAFGGIELGSSSIKGLTFVFQPGADTGVGANRSDRMKRLQYAERNASFVSMKDGCKLNERGMALLIKDTGEVVSELREGAKASRFGKLQLFVVGSSGLGAVCNTDEIVSRVQAATGLCAEFITASDEAKYILGFVLPKDRYRSLVINISGGNTLGGYYVTSRGSTWPPREWHGFELRYGARTLRDRALTLMKEMKDADGKPMPALTYYQAIDIVLRNQVGPELEQIKLENSGLQNFGQMYMVGGVVWATSTRTKPVQQEEWAISTLTAANFDDVMDKVKDGSFNEFDGSEFGIHVSAKTREAAEGELKDVLTRFDPQSLYAGVALGRFIIQETTPTAHVYFPTTAAWISGYARQKFRESGRTVPTCPVPSEEKQVSGDKAGEKKAQGKEGS